MAKRYGLANEQQSKRRKVNKQSKKELQEYAHFLIKQKQTTSAVYKHVTTRLEHL